MIQSLTAAAPRGQEIGVEWGTLWCVSRSFKIWERYEIRALDNSEAGSHHVPGKVGQPVDTWVDSTDKLQMLGFAHPLLDEEEDKAGRDEGHGKDNADGDHYVGGGCGPANEQNTADIYRNSTHVFSELKLCLLLVCVEEA